MSAVGEVVIVAVPVVMGIALFLLAYRTIKREAAVALWSGGATLLAVAPITYKATLNVQLAPELFASETYAIIVSILAVVSLTYAVLAMVRTSEPNVRTASRSRVPNVSRELDPGPRAMRRLLMREHKKHEGASEMFRYVELAVRNSQITIFMQDADLRYRWIVNPRLQLDAENAVGRTDYEVLPESMHALVVGHKKRALATRSTQSFEIEFPEADNKVWFRIDIVPVGSDAEGAPTGIVCAAIDITRAKRLDTMRTDLSRRLAETLQRFNLALRSEKIVVFSQDLGLRYTWANSDETQVGSVVGRTDEEVIPPADRPAIADIKMRAITTKQPQSGEVGVGEGGARRWFELYVEPNIQPDGTVSGITCASIDVTHRRRNEEQMRLVMRELTHRTKNLLAVVIAIARHTSTYADEIDTFVPALIGRLRALSAAQDLIVADDWAGVAIDDLLNALFRDQPTPSQASISVSGPRVVLSPEAAQNLGLAFHELATNAIQFGALSVCDGVLSVTWTVEDTAAGTMLDVTWREAGGPPAEMPIKRGFGTMVIERNLTRALRAKVSLDFHAEGGLSARLIVPLEGIVPVLRDDQKRLAEAS
ncbi:MAG: PAS domain-containing protein [Pseudomonadota bacterium]